MDMDGMATHGVPECGRNVDTFVGLVLLHGSDSGCSLWHRVDRLPSGLHGCRVVLLVVVRLLDRLGQCLGQLAQLQTGVVLFLFLLVVQPLVAL